MNVRKRGLALLMCICMIFTLLPFSALADTVAEYKGGNGGGGGNKPAEASYPLYIGIYIPDNNSNTIDWPNEPCVSSKTYCYVKSDNTLGILTNNSEGNYWKVSYTDNASTYIVPTKDNFVNQYGATQGADGTLGVYNQSGISSNLFKQDFLNDNMKTAIVSAYLEKQNKSNEDANNYQLVPYVLKFETSNEWHLDCVVLPNPSVTLSYDANLPEGASLPTGVGLPDNQTANGDQATINVQNMQYKGDYIGEKPVEVTANGKIYTFAGWSKTKDATTPYYDLESLANGSASITINSNTTLYAVWKDNTPKEYKVTYKYTGTVPDGANELLPGSQTVTENTEVRVADNPTLANYTFSGWKATDSSITATAGQKFTPTGDVTFQGQWTKNTVNYTVRYYWNGQPIPGVEEMTDSAAVGTEVNNISKTINGYTVKDNQPTKFTVSATASENIITINYYKDVKVSAGIYEKNVGDDLTDVGATVVGVTDGTVINYTLTGVPKNSNTAGEYPLNVSGDEIQGEYKVTYIDGTLTIYDTYTVTYKYEYENGTDVPKTVLKAPVDSNSPYREGATVTVEAAPNATAISGYTFIGWFTEDGTKINAKTFEMPNKDVVITGKWAPADTTYTIECYWGYDKQNRLPADTDGKVFSGKVGQKINLIDPPTITGYIATEADVITLQADGNVLKVYYLKEVTITPGNAIVTYNGKEHSVNTFSATTIDGDATDIMARYIYAYVAETNADVYPVGVFCKTAEVNPLAATDEVPAATALKVNDQIGGLYYVTAIGEGNLTINRAKVTVTAEDKSKYVGEKEPDFTAKVVGLVNDENESLIDYTITRDPGEKAGTYKIIPVGAKEQGNYEVAFKNGTLTIKSRPVNPGIYTEITVTITGNSDSVVYDGTEHNVKGYTVEISDSRYTEKDFTFSGKDIASGVNAGSYEMGLKSEQFKNTNALFKNVKFVIKADGVLTITPMDLTITAGSKDGIAPVTCNEYENTDLAKGDVIESVKITGEQLEPGQSPNVASDAVIKNAKGEDVTKNYNIKYVDGTLKAVEPLNKEDHFNYIVGYTDGTIRPNNNITRAEVAAIFFRLLTDEARSTFMTDDCSFSDVAQGAWCRRSIATLTNAEIISGYTDGTFKPNAPITRAELATIIARFAKLDVNTKTFSDINGHWAQKYIELAAGNGWIDGYTDGTFRPNQNIKRAETFAMINRVLDRMTKSNSDLLPTDQMNMWSDNMDFDAWYYRDVQEATNNHKAERVGDSIYEKWTEKLPDIDWAAIQL